MAKPKLVTPKQRPPWTPLTHEIYRLLRRERVVGKHLGLAVSGGADSMSLLAILDDLSSALKLRLTVLHVHHGPLPIDSSKKSSSRKSKTRTKRNFRDHAQEFVMQIAQSRNLPVETAQSTQILKSEKELRDFRRVQLLKWKRKLQLDLVVTAHHAGDLLETRMMRLIRGTGQNGLAAIHLKKGPWLRPLLHCSSEQLRVELRERKVTWLEDPSNKNTQFFRNWLRQVWLPQLSERVPGAMKRMALSLENLAANRTESAASQFLTGNKISRLTYLQLSVFEQKQSLAHLFFRLKTTNYSQNHIEEVRKRLDNSRTEHSFIVSGLEWRVNAEQISVSLANKGD